ncbi:MAG TPA: hypothetical protein DCS43_08965 [Verrucomicrobia bacterium]|nr:hypothetical protein [Verrucomicrobiota bacterium]
MLRMGGGFLPVFLSSVDVPVRKRSNASRSRFWNSLKAVTESFELAASSAIVATRVATVITIDATLRMEGSFSLLVI